MLKCLKGGKKKKKIGERGKPANGMCHGFCSYNSLFTTGSLVNFLFSPLLLSGKESFTYMVRT